MVRNLRIITLLIVTIGVAFLNGPSVAGPYDIAVVIGNKDYEKDRIPDVAFALRDAAAMKRYALDVLGVLEENLIFYENATKGDLETIFGNRVDYRGELWSYLDDEGSSRVLVYFSGHGIPGIRDKRGYLLPVNADPNTIEINGYPIDLLYGNLLKLPTTSVTVYLDACFSGDSQQGMILQDASPFGIKVTVPPAEGRLTVLTAASGDQIASWDRTAQHGMFTHHLLEALYGKADEDRNGEITVSEVEEYLRRRLSRAAKRTYRRIQKASVSGDKETVLAVLPSGGAVRPVLARVDEEKNVPVATEPPAPAEKTADDVAWEVVEGLRRPEGKRRALRGFVARYPQSRHRPKAEMLLLALGDNSRFQSSPNGTAAAETSPVDNPAKAPAPATPSFEIASLSGTYVVLRRSNLRSGPGTHYGKVGRVDRNKRVFVTGKVVGPLYRGKPWYRIEHRSGKAFIWSSLVADAAEIERKRQAAAAQAAAAASKDGTGGRTGREWSDPYTGMRFVYVPGGRFEMGCGSWTSRCDSDEKPVHQVTLDGFWLGKYEVTQGEWRKVMGSNPSGFKKGARHPVEHVSWGDAQAFIHRLNNKGFARFGLPSEAQWEYACRSGGKGEKYSGGSSVGTVAWYGESWDRGHHSVGGKQANGLGLHDMSGNVWEWVQDAKISYPDASQHNPIYESAHSRVFRGGGWSDGAWVVRCGDRYSNDPAKRYSDLGLRLIKRD